MSEAGGGSVSTDYSYVDYNSMVAITDERLDQIRLAAQRFQQKATSYMEGKKLAERADHGLGRLPGDDEGSDVSFITPSTAVTDVASSTVIDDALDRGNIESTNYVASPKTGGEILTVRNCDPLAGDIPLSVGHSKSPPAVPTMEDSVGGVNCGVSVSAASFGAAFSPLESKEATAGESETPILSGGSAIPVSGVELSEFRNDGDLPSVTVPNMEEEQAGNAASIHDNSPGFEVVAVIGPGQPNPADPQCAPPFGLGTDLHGDVDMRMPPVANMVSQPILDFAEAQPLLTHHDPPLTVDATLPFTPVLAPPFQGSVVDAAHQSLINEVNSKVQEWLSDQSFTDAATAWDPDEDIGLSVERDAAALPEPLFSDASLSPGQPPMTSVLAGDEGIELIKHPADESNRGLSTVTKTKLLQKYNADAKSYRELADEQQRTFESTHGLYRGAATPAALPPPPAPKSPLHSSPLQSPSRAKTLTLPIVGTSIPAESAGLPIAASGVPNTPVLGASAAVSSRDPRRAARMASGPPMARRTGSGVPMSQDNSSLIAPLSISISNETVQVPLVRNDLGQHPIIRPIGGTTPGITPTAPLRNQVSGDVTAARLSIDPMRDLPVVASAAVNQDDQMKNPVAPLTPCEISTSTSRQLGHKSNVSLATPVHSSLKPPAHPDDEVYDPEEPILSVPTWQQWKLWKEEKARLETSAADIHPQKKTARSRDHSKKSKDGNNRSKSKVYQADGKPLHDQNASGRVQENNAKLKEGVIRKNSEKAKPSTASGLHRGTGSRAQSSKAAKGSKTKHTPREIPLEGISGAILTTDPRLTSVKPLSASRIEYLPVPEFGQTKSRSENEKRETVVKIDHTTITRQPHSSKKPTGKLEQTSDLTSKVLKSSQQVRSSRDDSIAKLDDDRKVVEFDEEPKVSLEYRLKLLRQSMPDVVSDSDDSSSQDDPYSLELQVPAKVVAKRSRSSEVVHSGTPKGKDHDFDSYVSTLLEKRVDAKDRQPILSQNLHSASVDTSSAALPVNTIGAAKEGGEHDRHPEIVAENFPQLHNDAEGLKQHESLVVKADEPQIKPCKDVRSGEASTRSGDELKSAADRCSVASAEAMPIGSTSGDVTDGKALRLSREPSSMDMTVTTTACSSSVPATNAEGNNPFGDVLGPFGDLGFGSEDVDMRKMFPPLPKTSDRDPDSSHPATPSPPRRESTTDDIVAELFEEISRERQGASHGASDDPSCTVESSIRHRVDLKQHAQASPPDPELAELRKEVERTRHTRNGEDAGPPLINITVQQNAAPTKEKDTSAEVCRSKRGQSSREAEHLRSRSRSPRRKRRMSRRSSKEDYNRDSRSGSETHQRNRKQSSLERDRHRHHADSPDENAGHKIRQRRISDKKGHTPFSAVNEEKSSKSPRASKEATSRKATHGRRDSVLEDRRNRRSSSVSAEEDFDDFVVVDNFDMDSDADYTGSDVRDKKKGAAQHSGILDSAATNADAIDRPHCETEQTTETNGGWTGWRTLGLDDGDLKMDEPSGYVTIDSTDDILPLESPSVYGKKKGQDSSENKPISSVSLDNGFGASIMESVDYIASKSSDPVAPAEEEDAEDLLITISGGIAEALCDIAFDCMSDHELNRILKQRDDKPGEGKASERKRSHGYDKDLEHREGGATNSHMRDKDLKSSKRRRRSTNEDSAARQSKYSGKERLKESEAYTEREAAATFGTERDTKGTSSAKVRGKHRRSDATAANSGDEAARKLHKQIFGGSKDDSPIPAAQTSTADIPSADVDKKHVSRRKHGSKHKRAIAPLLDDQRTSESVANEDLFEALLNIENAANKTEAVKALEKRIVLMDLQSGISSRSHGGDTDEPTSKERRSESVENGVPLEASITNSKSSQLRHPESRDPQPNSSNKRKNKTKKNTLRRNKDDAASGEAQQSGTWLPTEANDAGGDVRNGDSKGTDSLNEEEKLRLEIEALRASLSHKLKGVDPKFKLQRLEEFADFDYRLGERTDDTHLPVEAAGSSEVGPGDHSNHADTSEVCESDAARSASHAVTKFKSSLLLEMEHSMSSIVNNAMESVYSFVDSRSRHVPVVDLCSIRKLNTSYAKKKKFRPRNTMGHFCVLEQQNFHRRVNDFLKPIIEGDFISYLKDRSEAGMKNTLLAICRGNMVDHLVQRPPKVSRSVRNKVRTALRGAQRALKQEMKAATVMLNFSSESEPDSDDSAPEAEGSSTLSPPAASVNTSDRRSRSPNNSKERRCSTNNRDGVEPVNHINGSETHYVALKLGSTTENSHIPAGDSIAMSAATNGRTSEVLATETTAARPQISVNRFNADLETQYQQFADVCGLENHLPNVTEIYEEEEERTIRKENVVSRHARKSLRDIPDILPPMLSLPSDPIVLLHSPLREDVGAGSLGYGNVLVQPQLPVPLSLDAVEIVAVAALDEFEQDVDELMNKVGAESALNHDLLDLSTGKIAQLSKTALECTDRRDKRSKKVSGKTRKIVDEFLSYLKSDCSRMCPTEEPVSSYLPGLNYETLRAHKSNKKRSLGLTRVMTEVDKVVEQTRQEGTAEMRSAFKMTLEQPANAMLAPATSPADEDVPSKRTRRSPVGHQQPERQYVLLPFESMHDDLDDVELSVDDDADDAADQMSDNGLCVPGDSLAVSADTHGREMPPVAALTNNISGAALLNGHTLLSSGQSAGMWEVRAIVVRYY